MFFVWFWFFYASCLYSFSIFLSYVRSIQRSGLRVKNWHSHDFKLIIVHHLFPIILVIEFCSNVAPQVTQTNGGSCEVNPHISMHINYGYIYAHLFSACLISYSWFLFRGVKTPLQSNSLKEESKFARGVSFLVPARYSEVSYYFPLP